MELIKSYSLDTQADVVSQIEAADFNLQGQWRPENYPDHDELGLSDKIQF